VNNYYCRIGKEDKKKLVEFLDVSLVVPVRDGVWDEIL